ncbi:MAG: hypothetical protein KGL40_05560 [Rhodocyclaceae bacterium]|nr:hypothetical protein [Rhodocyclaceae bacterium]
MVLLLIIVVLVAFFVWYHCVNVKHAQSVLEKIVARANAEHGLAFNSDPETSAGKATILFSTHRHLLFDTSNRKLMFVNPGRQEYSVHDYSYIDRWQLNWVEHSVKGRMTHRDVYFALSTNDINCPVINVPIISKKYGDEWNQRLRLLLKG